MCIYIIYTMGSHVSFINLIKFGILRVPKSRWSCVCVCVSLYVFYLCVCLPRRLGCRMQSRRSFRLKSLSP